MEQTTLIKNAKIVNEGTIQAGDVLIKKGRIEKIASNIAEPTEKCTIIDAAGNYLLPGMIDDQVHFRDPGLTQKADINSESKAAVAGGVTSYMDMPNTIPNTLTQELLTEKYHLGAQKSVANYSFFMGVNKTNIEEVLKTNNETVCGVTDDGLYFDDDDGILANYPDYLDTLFARVDTLIALHSEDDDIIKRNTEKYKQQFGEDIPFDHHPKIRSEEACVTATKRVLEIAKRHKTRFHLYHVSTAAEANLLDIGGKLRDKRITGEACVHHLFFNDKDYEKLGRWIKWNPSIKTEDDQKGLLKALLEGHLDIIATDHAPHTIEDKQGNYFSSKSGAPLVQHALTAVLELHHQGKITLPQVAEKTAHNVAEIYRMVDRGYIREGYHADLVLVSNKQPWTVTDDNILYKCGWTPMNGKTFHYAVTNTWVNGNHVYANGKVDANVRGQRLLFEKER
jgi:dihydroorotase